MGCGDATPNVQGGDPLFADSCSPGGAHSGNGWGDLYACYFGPTGKASCGGQTQCHSTDAGTGAGATYFVCGPSQEACWQGMSKVNPVLLHGALRHSDGTGGLMPKYSSVGFTPADLARIEAWLQQGAPNN
jgi:hypothetical protein